MGRSIYLNIMIYYEEEKIHGNIYRSPRDIIENCRKYTDEFASKLVDLPKCKNLIKTARNYNIALLKINENP